MLLMLFVISPAASSRHHSPALPYTTPWSSTQFQPPYALYYNIYDNDSQETLLCFYQRYFPLSNFAQDTLCFVYFPHISPRLLYFV